MTVVRVVITDDHPVVRTGLRALLSAEPDIEVAADCASGEDAVQLAADLAPDVVLMDLNMPGMDGVAATARVVAGTRARVLVLTTFETDGDILRAVEAGATSYLLKDTPGPEIVAAVRSTARGRTVLPAPIATRLVTAIRAPAPSPRELEVLELVARGMSNMDIGHALHISEATVKSHLLHVFAKFDVNDRTAAVTEACTRGWLRHD